MGVLKYSTLWQAVMFIQGSSSGEPAPPAPHAKTVFDPLTQQLDRARDVQNTVDRGADTMRKAVDSQERGDTSP